MKKRKNQIISQFLKSRGYDLIDIRYNEYNGFSSPKDDPHISHIEFEISGNKRIEKLVLEFVGRDPDKVRLYAKSKNEPDNRVHFGYCSNAISSMNDMKVAYELADMVLSIDKLWYDAKYYKKLNKSNK